MAIKNKDFVEIEYTGKITEDGQIFDTTDAKVATDAGVFNDHAHYHPMTVCVGEGQVIPGLDEALVGKDAGKSFSVDIEVAKAYGPKDAKLIQLISTAKFKKQKIQPMPGLQLNIDGQMGTIKTVSGGRTLVDFNHPLAGKDLSYDVKVNKILDDDAEKIKSILHMFLGIHDMDVKIDGKKAKITLDQEMPKELVEMLNKKITELLPSVEEISVDKKTEKKESLNKTADAPKDGGK